MVRGIAALRDDTQPGHVVDVELVQLLSMAFQYDHDVVTVDLSPKVVENHTYWLGKATNHMAFGQWTKISVTDYLSPILGSGTHEMTKCEVTFVKS